MKWTGPHSPAGTLHGLRVPGHVESVVLSAGRPIDNATRAAMERRFGEPLGDVRLHTDAAAARSASAMSAGAYALGRHIVFGPEGYAPTGAASRRRLAHELTHVVQQSRGGGSALSTAQREGEARQAARSIEGQGSMPRISAATPAISCDDGAGAPAQGAEAEATSAAIRCDIGALCRLRTQAPEVMSSTRLLQIYRDCHPGVPLTSLIAGDPCLTPNFGLPALPGTGPGATRTPGAAPGTGGAPAAGGGAGGGLSLPSTTIRFDLGPAAFTVSLPSSIAVQLPVPFRGAQRVVFALNASTSEFSFSVTVNAVPHVRIMARAAVTTEGRGTAGLTIQTTRTTCQAVNAAEARSALEAAGTKLRDAIQAVQTPPPPAPDASQIERDLAPQARLAEVVGAVAKVKSEIDRVSARCREVPVASFDFGVQGPLTTPETGRRYRRQPPASFIGGSLRLHF